MREILFRGKLADGNWSEGNLKVCKNGVYIITPDETIIGEYGRVIPETVGQYTGLTDKNGNKIFEGDIVRSCVGTYVVKFLTGSWCCSLIEREYLTLLSTISAEEVIGNIHDNPELLKGETK